MTCRTNGKKWGGDPGLWFTGISGRLLLHVRSKLYVWPIGDLVRYGVRFCFFRGIPITIVQGHFKLWITELRTFQNLSIAINCHWWWRAKSFVFNHSNPNLFRSMRYRQPSRTAEKRLYLPISLARFVDFITAKSIMIIEYGSMVKSSDSLSRGVSPH